MTDLANMAQQNIFKPCIAHNWWGGWSYGEDDIRDVNDPYFMVWILPTALGDAIRRTINLWDASAS